MLNRFTAVLIFTFALFSQPLFANETKQIFNTLEKCERFYIQKFLMDKGFYDSVLDGKWGTGTSRALDAYIKNRTIADAIGNLVKKSDCAEISYYQITDEIALNAIINNRTVIYTKESTKNAGMVQKFYRSGRTSYAKTEGYWKMMKGKFCSHYPKWNKDGEWACYPVFVNRAGTMIRWDGVTNTWYGRIR